MATRVISRHDPEGACIHHVPVEWNVTTRQDYWGGETFNCAECGVLLEADELYDSHELTDEQGCAYKVCWDCFEREMGRRRDRLSDW